MKYFATSTQISSSSHFSSPITLKELTRRLVWSLLRNTLGRLG